MIFIYFLFSILIIILKNYFKYLINYNDWTTYIKNVLSDLGKTNIIFLKLLQWTCTKNDNENNYINQEIIEYINSFTNNTPYSYTDIDWELLTNTFQKSINQNDRLIIDSFVPINSGSISLVFKGNLNNKPVAIKILRKNILPKIIEGIYLLENIISIINFLGIYKQYEFDSILSNSKQEILEQINFNKEVSNLQIFKSHFKKNKLIVIPDVYSEYTLELKNIIIMDWIEGINVNSVSIDDKNNIENSYSKYIFSSYVMKGIIHGDLHQGNIIFLKDIINNKEVWKVGLIDFGTIIILNVDEINFINVFLEAIFNSKLNLLIDYINENKYILFDNLDINNLNNSLNEIIILNNQDRLFNSFNMSNLDNEILTFLKIIRNNNCKIKANIYKIISTLIPQAYIHKMIQINLNKEENKHTDNFVNQMNKLKNRFEI